MFDCQSLKYKNTDAEFVNLRLFKVFRIVELVKPYLVNIPFEIRPFREHILLIKRIIADNLPPKYREEDESSSSSTTSEEEPPKPPPEPEIIYKIRTPEKKEMVPIQT